MRPGLADPRPAPGGVAKPVEQDRPAWPVADSWVDGSSDRRRQWHKLLAERGQVEDAIQVLRARADNGDRYATRGLVSLLAKEGKEGKVEELEREVAAGTAGAVATLRRIRSRVSSHGD